MYGVAPPKSSDSGGGAANQAAFLRTFQAWKGSNVTNFTFSLCFFIFIIF